MNEMRLDWSNPVTWVLAGALVVVLGLAIAGFGGDSGAGNPVAIVGVIFMGIGAVTWAVNRGLRRRGRR